MVPCEFNNIVRKERQCRNNLIDYEHNTYNGKKVSIFFDNAWQLVRFTSAIPGEGVGSNPTGVNHHPVV